MFIVRSLTSLPLFSQGAVFSRAFGSLINSCLRNRFEYLGKKKKKKEKKYNQIDTFLSRSTTPPRLVSFSFRLLLYVRLFSGQLKFEHEQLVVLQSPSVVQRTDVRRYRSIDRGRTLLRRRPFKSIGLETTCSVD